MIKKLFSHSLIYAIGPKLPMLASLFVMPIITKDLTKLDYGVSGVVTAYTSAIGALQTLGLTVILANSFYKRKKSYKLIWRHIYGFLILWSPIYTILLSVLLFLIIPFEAQENKFYIIIIYAIPSILFGPLDVIGNLYFRLSQRPVPIVLLAVLTGFLSVFLNLYTISYLKLGYMGWFVSIFLSTIISNAFYFYYFNFKILLRPILTIRIKSIKRYLKVSLPTIPHEYSIYLLNSSSRAVMDLLKIDTRSVGIYNLGQTFANYFGFIISSVGQASSPFYLEIFSNKNKQIGDLSNKARDLTFIITICTMLFTFTGSIWMKELFEILIKNKSLQSAYPIAIILIMGFNYRPMFIGGSNILFYKEKTSQLWKVSFLAGVGSVVLNFALISSFGFFISAVISFVSYMYFGYAVFFLSEYKKLKTSNYFPLIWLLFTLILTCIVFFSVELPVIYKVLINLTLFLVALLLFVKLYNRSFKIT